MIFIWQFLPAPLIACIRMWICVRMENDYENINIFNNKNRVAEILKEK